ncbi:hypothetical protein I545_6818 [Mycobacterium kansasii 662]|uniref:Uncharacterized protein n=1 Tax=Mycobacterium kansasii 662 TaxID=1299326 RepID=X7XT29_MYCKA|nr:hypothetical protein I545_6818 [Mycobacterium kansasii 662]
MLDTKAIRCLGSLRPPKCGGKPVPCNPLGAHFDAFVNFVPDRHNRRAIEAAIARRAGCRDDRGALLWGSPRQVGPSCGPSATRGCATWSSHPCPVLCPSVRPANGCGPPCGSPAA